MIAFQHIHFFTVFSLIIYVVSTLHNIAIENEPTLDGHEFIKKIVKGEKMDDAQGILYFTAPYRICSGKGCYDKNTNFHMVFPLYIGTKAQQKYRTIYTRDYENVHSTRPNVPFKKYPTKRIWTLPPNCTTDATTETTTETATTPDSTTETPDDADHTSDDVDHVKPPSVKPHCPVRISKVHFGPTTPEKSFRVGKRYFGKG